MNIIKLKIGVSGIVTTGESDLTNYYTKLEIDNKNFLTEHQDISNKLDKEEAANTYLPKGNYLTEHQSLEQYAKKSEIPTSTNQLTNDSGFLTLHLDISNLATKTELATKADKEHTHSQYLTEHQSLKGYAKETWVKNEIANASLQGGDVDLSGYATKEDLTVKLDTSIYNQDKLNFATKDEIPSLDGYLKEVPTEYVTETELNGKNYLTSHQDISGKLDKSEATTLYQKKGNYIESIPEEYVTSTELAQEGFLKEHLSLEGYAKETWVTQKITDAQLSGGEVDLTPYATKEELKGYQPKGEYLTSVPAEYVTETELTLKDYLTSKDIANKADKSQLNDMATKTWTNLQGFLKEHQSLANYATKSEVEAKQDTLIGTETIGQNIKTINGESILGTGNITVEGGSGGGIREAPTDGNQYTRGDRRWNKINVQDFALNIDLDNKADKVKRVNNDVTTLEIKPNTLYVWNEVASLNITLANPTDSTIANEYMFQFTSGTQPTTLSLPQDIKWIGDNKIEANKTYQVSIVNNIAIMGGV